MELLASRPAGSVAQRPVAARSPASVRHGYSPVTGLGQVGWPSAGFHAFHDLGVAAAAEVPHQPQQSVCGRRRVHQHGARGISEQRLALRWLGERCYLCSGVHPRQRSEPRDPTTTDKAGAHDLRGRREWRGLLDFAMHCKVDLIVVWKLDRAFRSVVDGAKTVQSLRSGGCGIRSPQEPWIDTTTPIGEAMYHITIAWAQLEKRQRTERVKAGMERRDPREEPWAPRALATGHQAPAVVKGG